MRKTRKQLAIIVTACMLVFFAGSAFALTAGQFSGAVVPGGVTVTISGVSITPGLTPNPYPHLVVQAAFVSGNQFIVEFDVFFTAPGQYIEVEFEVFNHTNQVLTITEVISNHARGNPYGIVVTQSGPMAAPGVNVVPALDYGIITMHVLWDEDEIDWNYMAYAHKIDGTFDFSTIIRFEQPATSTPTTTPTPTITPTSTPPAPPPPPTPTPTPIQTPEPTPYTGGGIGDGNGGADNEAEGDNDYTQEYEDDEDIDPPADAVVAPDDDDDADDINGADDDDSDYNGNDQNDDADDTAGHGHNGENPQTGDNFSGVWLITALIGFSVSAAVLALLVVAGRKQKAE